MNSRGISRTGLNEREDNAKAQPLTRQGDEKNPNAEASSSRPGENFTRFSDHDRRGLEGCPKLPRVAGINGAIV
jgi:hypothetical protein